MQPTSVNFNRSIVLNQKHSYPPTIRRHLPNEQPNTKKKKKKKTTSTPTRDSESENTITNTNTGPPPASGPPAKHRHTAGSVGATCFGIPVPPRELLSSRLLLPPSGLLSATANPDDSDSRRIKVAVPSPAGGPLHSCNVATVAFSVPHGSTMTRPARELAVTASAGDIVTCQFERERSLLKLR